MQRPFPNGHKCPFAGLTAVQRPWPCSSPKATVSCWCQNCVTPGFISVLQINTRPWCRWALGPCVPAGLCGCLNAMPLPSLRNSFRGPANKSTLASFLFSGAPHLAQVDHPERGQRDERRFRTWPEKAKSAKERRVRHSNSRGRFSPSSWRSGQVPLL
jgi:hypothetical protein